MTPALLMNTPLPTLHMIDERKGNSELVEYVPAAESSGNLHFLMQLMVAAEEQRDAETAETALALQRYRAESKQRVDELLKEILSLKEELVKSDGCHRESELLLRAQIVVKDQELAARVSEVRKLTLKISELEERTNQSMNAALVEKNKAVSNAIKAGKVAEETAVKAGEAAVQVIKAQMAAMQVELVEHNARLQDAEARIDKLNAEKLAAEQTAASQIAELTLRIQMLETQNGKLQRGAEALKQSIRDTFEFSFQPVSQAERDAMEADFKNKMENS